MSKAGAQSAPKPRKRKANGYKFPDKLPKGEILRDTAKKDWILGDSIGQGGFGEIYSAAEATSKNDLSYVIKIEPHENGPLFMEKNFYIKAAKPDDIKSWKQKQGLKTLGMPVYIGSGTHFHKDIKYRFLVMERFGQDLWSLFLSAKTFPPHTVYKCALQIIDTLHYIHSKEYVHGDIKGANLLLGRKPGTENTVFVVDFGLACRYSQQKEFQKDPKQAHNGTIEYTSCDWHLGVPTRRGDLEILGFNLLHWLSGSLPWEKDITNKETVHKKKQDLMSNVESYLKKNFSGISQVMTAYMTYISKLKHNEEPNYKYIKDLFTKELKQIGSSPIGPLEFKASKPSAAGTPSRRVSSAGTPSKRVSTRRSLAHPASDHENEAPAKVAKKRRAGKAKVSNAVQNVLSGSDEDEAEISPIAPVKRSAKAGTRTTKATATKRRGAKAAAAVVETSGSDSDELEISPIVSVKKHPGQQKKQLSPSMIPIFCLTKMMPHPELAGNPEL
uniref:non-specific serine/threonine protein kinase n=1 Tax=Lygus hesperus TaxID=30085 RepID=A0A0A9XX25_LYGHE